MLLSRGVGWGGGGGGPCSVSSPQDCPYCPSLTLPLPSSCLILPPKVPHSPPLRVLYSFVTLQM